MLIVLYMYDVILGMNFLNKYNASIESRHQRIVIELKGEEQFQYMGEPRKETKMHNKCKPMDVCFLWLA